MSASEFTPSSSYPVLGRWTLVKLLGTGSTAQVYLGVDNESQQQAAVKIYKLKNRTSGEYMKKETRILRNLSHQHVLGLIESYDLIDLQYPESSSSEKVAAVVMEYAQKGEFFEFIKQNQFLLEDTSRLFFRQLIAAISHLHAKNIAHQDIKLENLLLDESSTLKLADFGYSSEFAPNKLERTFVGTTSYFSPELHYRRPHTADSSDLFAAGIVLFNMVTGHMPFLKAKEEDKLYAYFCEEDQSEFWSYHESLMEKKGSSYKFSESFKDLIRGMFNVNPSSRLTLDEITNHPWVTAVN